MRRISIGILIVMLLAGCSSGSTEPTITPTSTPPITRPPQTEPSATPTITLSPTPTEEPKWAFLSDCDELDIWKIEHFYAMEYEEAFLITIDTGDDLVTFCMAKIQGDWQMLWYSFG